MVVGGGGAETGRDNNKQMGYNPRGCDVCYEEKQSEQEDGA